MKKSKRKRRKTAKGSEFPELATERNDEEDPRIIDITSRSADSVRGETNKEVTKTEKPQMEGNAQNPEMVKTPFNSAK